MPATAKTDNHNPAAKLALRRYFLAKYHGPYPPLGMREHPDGSRACPGLRVLDCCQGSMKLWGELRHDFPCRYLGLDVKPKAGRLKLDSARFLAGGGWDFNCIDVDTYGSPWKHWAAILENAPGPLTVFLTIGMVAVGGGNYDRALLPFLGLDLKRLTLPNSLGVRLSALGTLYALHAPSKAGLTPSEIIEAFPSSSARYLGIRLSLPS